MKRLIDACFLHVDLPLVRPHVLAGHFDLLGETRISHDGTFLTLGLPSVVSSSYHSTSSKEIQTTSTHSSPNDENDGQSSSSSPSSASSVQSEAQRVLLESTQPLAESAIILPELWEDFVVRRDASFYDAPLPPHK